MLQLLDVCFFSKDTQPLKQHSCGNQGVPRSQDAAVVRFGVKIPEPFLVFLQFLKLECFLFLFYIV